MGRSVPVSVRIVLRDHGHCIRCGAPGDDVCHILPKGRYPELRSEEKNLCVLCRQCHVACESYAGRCELLTLMREKYGYEYEEKQYEGYT